jgi:DNA-binding MarR family transcriptional regulator/GNAT superfamily N-acetyltransferase
MRRLLEKTDKDISNIYRELGMDFEARWFSLLYLLSQESPVTITGAAESLGYTHPAINKLAAQMERKGLLTSSTSGKDRRKRLLRLTAKGRKTAGSLKPVWEDIRIVLRDLLAASDHDLLLAIGELERCLAERSLYSRIFDRMKNRLLEEIEILDYRPSYRERFASLNSQWLKKHFRIEKHDAEVLADPARKIIEPGGAVIFARVRGRIVGTCALLRHGEGVFELSKMAVAEGARRRSVGTALTLAMIDRARSLGARDIYVETHPSLVGAQRLYGSLGFRRITSGPIPKRYRRKRILMKLELRKETT